MRELQLDLMPRTKEALIESLKAQNRARQKNLFGLLCSLLAVGVGYAGVHSKGVRAILITLLLLGGIVGVAVYAIHWWSSQRLMMRTLDAIERLDRQEGSAES